MTHEEYLQKKAMLLSSIQERTWEINSLQMIRRDLIQDLRDLERQKPQRAARAFRE